MKRHPSLIPLVVIVGVGGVGAFFYTARLALRNPDVRCEFTSASTFLID